MRVYLTTSQQFQDRLPYLRGWLVKQGHTVVSTWFDRDPSVVPESILAAFDLVELDEAQAIIVYNPDPNATSAGAKDFECGYAYHAGKQLFYIGNAGNYFVSRYGKPWPTSIPNEVT